MDWRMGRCRRAAAAAAAAEDAEGEVGEVGSALGARAEESGDATLAVGDGCFWER